MRASMTSKSLGKSGTRTFNEKTAKPSGNPLGDMNPKQAELAFIKQMKSLGITNEKLIKNTLQQVKPINAD